ncbi:artemis protein [Apiospora sp. TS-2023a]
MSTFDGVVHEFPDIAIDYFRLRARPQPPRLCLLSHVHSDHLAGLETLRGPFVYCSAATREILLRLERYPCRINYAKGTLEARKQTYKHLKHILKPIPLETPTQLELWPGKYVQVTLFDANHCVGAVMFLIEGDGKAVLYTGDIRSEPWWVNSLARNPALVEYAQPGGLKTLDRIYLDTSVLDDYPLNTKAEGLRDLLTQVARYPADTVFFVQAWTYGYEDVWIALAKALGSKIHVDAYRMGIYKSLVERTSEDLFAKQVHLTKEAPYLVGFSCANNQHDGCLTLDENVRIHSCEKGTACSVIQNKYKSVVWIKPIVSRLPDGQEIAEVGIGGGGGDLEREAELQYITADNLDEIVSIIRDLDGFPVETRETVIARILASIASGRNASLNIDIDDFSDDDKMEADLIKAVRSAVTYVGFKSSEQLGEDRKVDGAYPLPRTIAFPYARHSSYPELRHLVDTFKPKDIWPCTVHDEDWFHRGITLRELFGQDCSEDIFEHDEVMEQRRAQLASLVGDGHDQDTQVSDMSVDMPSQLQPDNSSPGTEAKGGSTPIASPLLGSSAALGPAYQPSQSLAGVSYQSLHEGEAAPRINQRQAGSSSFSPISDEDLRAAAFKTMQSNVDGYGWAPIELISTTGNHSVLDTELGSLQRGKCGSR